jgi:GT2 family glycosyltransferase
MENIAIVILNWNNSDTTIQCVNSLKDIKNVIIVDNNSAQKDIDNLKHNLPPYTKLILNTINLGFAGGNNTGIRYAIDNLKVDYILLLNNDTIVSDNFLKPLLEIIQTDQSIGAVQPKILKHSDQSILDSAGQKAYPYGSVKDRGLGKLDKALFQEKEEIFGVCGAAVLYRASVLKETGLFDERLFCLFEDVDLSWRIRLKGYKIMYEPKSIIYHDRGISGKINKKNIMIRRFYGFRNCLIITLRYYPSWLILLFLPVHLYRFFTALYFKLKYKIHAPFFSLFKDTFINRDKLQKTEIIKELQHRWI